MKVLRGEHNTPWRPGRSDQGASVWCCRESEVVY
jgi:hypothetical protein